jgi:hypothetical protein
MQDLHNDQYKTGFDRNTKNGTVNAYCYLRSKNDRLLITVHLVQRLIQETDYQSLYSSLLSKIYN